MSSDYVSSDDVHRLAQYKCEPAGGGFVVHVRAGWGWVPVDTVDTEDAAVELMTRLTQEDHARVYHR